MPETEALTQRWKETDENGATRKSILLKSLRSDTDHAGDNPAENPKDLHYIDLRNETQSGPDFSGTDLTGAVLTRRLLEENFVKAQELVRIIA